jgi:hypothetical protein
MGRLHISFSAVDMSTDDEYHSVAALLRETGALENRDRNACSATPGRERMYFLARHEPIDRFKPMDEDNYLAFDSATGQLLQDSSAYSNPREAHGPARSVRFRSGSARSLQSWPMRG